MKALVTGSDGFIGKNLIVALNELPEIEVLKFNRDMNQNQLEELVSSADFIFHLAGVNRSDSADEFVVGNKNLTLQICNILRKHKRSTSIVFSSSIQASEENVYGRSKLDAETHLKELNADCGNSVSIYRLPNVFGKWSRPNYNSVVSTFCYNISRDIPIRIDNERTELQLVHIDAVTSSFIAVMDQNDRRLRYVSVKPVYQVTVGELAKQIEEFKKIQSTHTVPTVGDGFVRLLYSTYISYLDPKNFSYSLLSNDDHRGSFVEMLKTPNSGQFSYFTAHPGVTRGGHYHHIKTEKFLILKGKAKFRFRHIVTNEHYEITVSGSKPEVVETIPGWAHDITNIGDDELVAMLWANEVFDPDNPDTVYFEV